MWSKTFHLGGFQKKRVLLSTTDPAFSGRDSTTLPENIRVFHLLVKLRWQVFYHLRKANRKRVLFSTIDWRFGGRNSTMPRKDVVDILAAGEEKM